MAEYLPPGVYVEEISMSPPPIEGVSTSTAGFVGQTERGPGLPRLVTSWLEFQRWYGGHVPVETSFLPFAVQGFFDNGGLRLFVARVTRADATTASLNLATADAAQSLQVRAAGAGDWGERVFVRVRAGSRAGTRLTVLYYRQPPPVPLVDPTNPANAADPNRREPDAAEDYDNLLLDPEGGGYVVTEVNSASKLVQLLWADDARAPALPNALAFAPLGGGGDGAAALAASDFLGDPALPTKQRRGLAGLEAIDEISILCVPDEVHPALGAPVRTAITDELVNQCERLRDRFAVLQVPGGSRDVATILPPRDSSYAAIYYPWIHVPDPRTQDAVLVPPGGHVVGIYARTDVERGVHKAPANAEVRGIITRDLPGARGPLEFNVTKGQQDVLNPRGINVIRDFRRDGGGVRVWGARTTSSDAEWKYVSIRRLSIFIEESIDKGTQWVVFEPNDEPTWDKVRRSVSNFLLCVWRSGALMGTKAEDAFFVKCGRATMTQDDIDKGRLVCYVGIAPVRPAEFVILRFSQKTMGCEK